MDDEAWQPQSDNDQHSKMFVGGLAQTVTSDFLKAYFSNYGPVQDAFVLMDEQSGRSRGFGFVTFEDPLTLKNVLRQKPHILGNKQVDCKHAVNKNIKRAPKNASVPNFCSAWATAYDSRQSVAPDEAEATL
ncbi:RNA recognition motif (RRM) containing protein [Gregarina niphandrodes]|uniref:RNA recognition motif (RRM) containing protein n=1 Tax=Gregarina niphandrodes TaxID=110365 RepID=A0A023B3K5_GRENI|nr:RNA recognition motif (RRM) containing protein [Gregarina niphandrodes]EZG55419.1 RNA recognition motif (RRM) containing protein [Gregarina niphandrodes]|eukprot:XP_011131559.1 RNA recognition motif (RRM) containing protein [Gregarina niphandrodes]